MKKTYLLIFLIGLIAISSCRQHKKMTYFSDLGDQSTAIISEQPNEEYRIRPHDILYIKILTPDEAVMNLFNSISMPGGIRYGGSNQNFSEEGLYYTGFSVSETGYIDMPIMGKITVQNLTIK